MTASMRRAISSPEVRAVFEEAEQLGCQLSHGSKHIRITLPNGRVEWGPVTPRGGRSHLKLASRLRRAGIAIGHR